MQILLVATNGAAERSYEIEEEIERVGRLRDRLKAQVAA